MYRAKSPKDPKSQVLDRRCDNESLRARVPLMEVSSSPLSPLPRSEILVCQAGTCRAAGSEAVYLEIEELSKVIEHGCIVRQSGCLGLCSQAPAAIVLQYSNGEEVETTHTRLKTLETSADVIRSPSL